MARGNFIKFLLNEEITVGGKPMKDDDEKEPNYSGGGDEETPKEDPPADPPATDPAPDNTEESTPDYTGDSPDGGEENPEPNPEPEPDATTTDGNTPENNNPTPDPEETPEENPEGGDGEEPEPDYNTDPENPDGNGEETPDPGIEDGDGEEPEPDYNTDPENPDQGTPEENPDGGDGEETPDYNTDPNNPDGAEDPGNPDGEEGDPDYTAGGNGEDTGDGTADAGDTIDGSITQMQTDVFSNLTPNQIALKIKELKTQYVNLFSDINGIIERLSQITRKEDNIDTLQFVSKKFLELKDMVKDSLVYSFDDNSYVQNQITLKEFFAIYVNLITLIEKLGEGQDKK